MSNDVAVFLDLDNLVIGAKQANLAFDINLVLDHIKRITNGRIVLRHAYGAGRQSQALLQELAQAGFIVQSATRINSFSKNLADMQIVVNAMDTLVDGHQYNTYVLMSGDRDFTPLVQSLRKRGKHVVGVGIRRTTSGSLAELCDEYYYYEDLIPTSSLSEEELARLVRTARDSLLGDQHRVRASIFKERMVSLSNGSFDSTSYPQGSFSKFLYRFPELVRLDQEESTTYVIRPGSQVSAVPLADRYRTALKKQRLRVVPPEERFAILHALIRLLRAQPEQLWQELLGAIHSDVNASAPDTISKNMVNGLLLVARQAQVIRTRRGKTLSTAPVLLSLESERPFQEAVLCVDRTYLQAILDVPDPFDFDQAALALYDNTEYVPYLRRLSKRIG
jgi:uncharacterized LabA/DUF88 family protein